MRWLFLSFALMGSLCQAQSGVIATIKPLQLIADAVAEGVVEVGLLTNRSADPHAFALKPSEMRRLSAARLVLWVGPGFEHYLVDTRVNLEKTTRFLAMMDAGDELENAHLWLDPARAARYGAKIRDALVTLYPDQADRLNRNYNTFVQSLSSMIEDIERRLAPLHRRPYLVHHDAYAHFESYFDLSSVGVIQPGHMGNPGAKRLVALREQVKSDNVRCIFIETPQIPREVGIIKADRPVKVVPLDPLARDVARGPHGYVNFLDQVTAGIEACLR